MGSEAGAGAPPGADRAGPRHPERADTPGPERPSPQPPSAETPPDSPRATTEGEGAASDPDVGGATAMPPLSAASMDDEELEELMFSPSINAPSPLLPGAVLGPDDRLAVQQHLGARGRINSYAATWQEPDGQTVAVELREGPADHEGLARERDVLSAMPPDAMLPKYHAAFEAEGRGYLALGRLEGQTLEDALRRGIDIEQAISIAVQLAQVLRRLHGAGWALVGLSPSAVVLGQPIQVNRLDTALKIGTAPAAPMHVAGYSAPELADADVITGKEDVFALGAMVYRAAAGVTLPESGAELSMLSASVRTPGLPQLLAQALAAADERPDLETFYRALLVLKQQLASAPLALEVASATTVGLNPTRTVNEDSCGYAAAAAAGSKGSSYQAILYVADGMGGMEAGEVASGAAVRTVLHASLRALGSGSAAGEPPLDVVALVREAGRAVHDASGGRDVGTTLTCMLVREGELTLGHIGDTRAYLLRGDVLSQLTADHSLVAAMVASGVLSKAEARGHPDSNKVLRSLGGRRELPDGYVDGLDAVHGQPTLRLEHGDWILLCSDGIWGSVDDETIRGTIAGATDATTVARALVDLALRAGAPDNASAVVARCVKVAAT